MTNEAWLDAQYSVLGSALIESRVVPMVMQQTTERDYYGTCLTVYKAMRQIFLDGRPVDPVIVVGMLGREYQPFILQLMEITPTAANVERYIAICREQAKANAIREIGKVMGEETDGGKLRSLVEEASGLLADRPGLRITTMADALKSFMERHTRETRYLSWPVRELDGYLYSEPGDLIVIGGYPSSGKSAWALQCAWYWAREYKVGFFSLETSSEKLFDRQMSAVLGLSMDNIKRNTIDQAGWDHVCRMADKITARNLELIPAAGMTPADVRAVTMMRGYQIILIDYLQLLQGSGDNRTAQVTQISIALHTMAQSMGVTVVALSQLARQDKQNKNAPPDMSALRESGQIEQDADLIMMLSLEKRDGKETGNRELRIRKNKEGTCPNILLAFDGKHQTFSKADPVSEQARENQRIKEQVKPKPTRPVHQPESRPQKPTAQQQETAARVYGQETVLPDNTPVPFRD